MAKKESIKPEEQYFKVPYNVLKAKGLEFGAKILYCHIYSFGKQGCYQTNAQLADIFAVNPRTISRWISSLKKVKSLLFIFPGSSERVLWAKKHPKVRSAKTLPYRDVELSKEDIVLGKYEKCQRRQNVHGGNTYCHGNTDKNGMVTTTNCPATNKSTTLNTIAMPAPSPAGGQASALPNNPKREQLTPEEFEQRKQKMIKDLMESEKNKNNC